MTFLRRNWLVLLGVLIMLLGWSFLYYSHSGEYRYIGVVTLNSTEMRDSFQMALSAPDVRLVLIEAVPGKPDDVVFALTAREFAFGLGIPLSDRLGVSYLGLLVLIVGGLFICAWVMRIEDGGRRP